MKYTSGFCKLCESRNKLERKSPNHILHTLLSVISAGFWIPMWALISVWTNPWTCSKCGTKKVAKDK